MYDVSRRSFLRGVGAGGGILASFAACDRKNYLQSVFSNCAMCCANQHIRGDWLFRIDPQDEGELEGWHLKQIQADDWSRITVPHTWQIAEGNEEYMGKAWYRCEFEGPKIREELTVRVEFEAVYHSATVWLNGAFVGEHLRKGYTAFTLDISSGLRPGEENILVVRVDNSFDEKMLPRGDSFDWNADGGIIRPVNLLFSPKTYIERVDIDAKPDVRKSEASLGIKLVLRNCAGTRIPLDINYRVMEDNTGRTVLRKKSSASVTLEPGVAEEVCLPEATLDSPRLWHFDHPHLYHLVAEIEHQGKPLHQYCTTFGVRKIEVDGGGFLLNGERVWLMGVERMGGSYPSHGMAEPESLISRDHQEMKEANCVFTRVHWPQDKRVLDYCDRHGILIQVEVPAWGGRTFRDMGPEPDPEIMENGLEQLREMIHRDRNHPCIFSWGLANEIKGQNPPAYQFVKRMYEEAKRLDPDRLCSYASDSLYESPGNDVSALMDFVEWNEYWESWYPGTLEDMRNALEEIHRAFPDKPLVISEYGYLYSYPGFTGGEKRLIEVLRTHTDVFREFDFIGGAIFFSFNDYRTQMGDVGHATLKQRLCGVVDIFGERKRSFEVLRQESSPVELLGLVRRKGKLTARLVTRKKLPAYRLEGYKLRWIVYGFEEMPMEQYETPLPELSPGEDFELVLPFEEKKPGHVRVDIIRPTGFSMLTAYWKA